MIKISRGILFFLLLIVNFKTYASNEKDDVNNLTVIVSKTRNNNGETTVSIGGNEMSRCSDKIIGVSNVECYQLVNSKNNDKVYFKNHLSVNEKHRVFGEIFDAIIASRLLRAMAVNMGEDPAFPEIRLAVNEGNEIIGILSYELKNYISFIELYTQNTANLTQDSINDTDNAKNPFYCKACDEKRSESIALFYSFIFLVGIGDLNPGNICISSKNVCKQCEGKWSFGTFDLDVAFKKSLDYDTQFDEVLNICKKLVKENEYGCVKNILSYYGISWNAVREKYSLAKGGYFLEKTWNAAQEDSAYVNRLCDDKAKCGLKFDPYNYREYRRTNALPMSVNDIINSARNITRDNKLESLQINVRNTIEGLENIFKEKERYLRYLNSAKQHIPIFLEDRYMALKRSAEYTDHVSSNDASAFFNFENYRYIEHEISGIKNIRDFITLCNIDINKDCCHALIHTRIPIFHQ
jgi:hypothetical protein